MHRWHSTEPPHSQSSAMTPAVGKGLQRLLVSAVVSGILMSAVEAADTAPLAISQQESWGTIVGIVTNAVKLPIAQATVTALRADGHGIRSTISGSNGVYSFADLPPGAWTVTVQSEGYADTSAALQVLPAKATCSDIVMNAPATNFAGAVAAAPRPAPSTPNSASVSSKPADGLWARLTTALNPRTTAVACW